MPNETDRQCVVRVSKSGNVDLDAEFGMSPNVVGGATRPDCLLSIDGHACPSITSGVLLQGSALLRVGGFRSTAKHGEYVWFEPLLREGVHYFRSSVLNTVDASSNCLINFQCFQRFI